ncbi:UDP-N-acetylmuramyl pentapeptide phosphotransferase/UDP-N-acetylglucosamine-1-phosphate transferase [Actinopolymorpha cephalotaxi]|nr:hypothetical protein [Actinopolymorpha cephalotaxi]SFF76726.1 UDP-N-acetylmuramyl pentapeptide phosphotransferase/UDP-N-acetylglucosamine-1-phosphate transferase [Actinopolymorpha cephalotaxi]
MPAVVLAAAFASLGLQGVLLPVLRRYVVDIPNNRSSHAMPTARGGGLAVVAGIWLGIVAGYLAAAPVPWSVVVMALALSAALGLADDMWTLGALPRLGIQLVLGLSLALWMLETRTALSGISLVLAAAVATIWLAGFTNAFNFMDGVNGISALNAIVAGAWYAYVGWHWSVDNLTTLGLAVAGAAAGFLPWNFPKARVFLGDVGSYAIGMALAGLALWAAAAGVPLWSALAPLLVYVVDTSWTLTRRVASGQPWKQAHRDHIYQRLVAGGWSHARSAMVSAFAAVGCCAAALVTETVGPIVGVLLLAIGAGCYLLLPQTIHGDSASARLQAPGRRHAAEGAVVAPRNPSRAGRTVQPRPHPATHEWVSE